jgi:hypothetical protein
MGQKKLKTGLGFETLAQTRNRADNGPKKRGPTMGLNELGPLNIYLKLEIGPTIGQREIFPSSFFLFLVLQHILHSTAH